MKHLVCICFSLPPLNYPGLWCWLLHLDAKMCFSHMTDQSHKDVHYGELKWQKMDRKMENKKEEETCVSSTDSSPHSHSQSVTAGGISVHGASLNFCAVNSFQM